MPALAFAEDEDDYLYEPDIVIRAPEETYDLYDDGDYEFLIDCSKLNEKETDYSVKITVSGGDNEDDEIIWNELNGDELYSYDSEVGTLTLHGEKVWEQIKGYSEPMVSIEAAALDTEGEEIDSDYLRLSMREAHTEYYLPEDYEELVGQYSRILRYCTGEFFGSSSPDGKDFDYEITSVSVNEKDAEYDSEEGEWYFRVGEGANNVKITYSLYDPDQDGTSDKTEVWEYTVTGKKEMYSAWISSSKNIAAPGEELVFEGEGYRDYYDAAGEYIVDHKLDYHWEVTEGKEYAEIKKQEFAADNSWSRVTVRIKDNIDPAVFDEDCPEVRITLSVSKKGSNRPEASDYDTFDITDSYTEMEISPEINRYMLVGETAAITPVVKEHTYREKGKAASVTTLENLGYRLRYDTESVEIKQGDQMVIPYEESDDGEADTDTDNNFYTGPFTIKRLLNTDDEVIIEAYNLEGEYPCCLNSIYFDFSVLYSFKNPELLGIENRIYNGKAQTQKVKFTVDDPEIEDDRWCLDEGDHYKLVYKNNINAGTATVEVVGIGAFSGNSFSKTFKIAKANQSPSVAVKAVKVKAKKTKKKAQKVNALTVKGALGAVSFSGTGVNKKSKKALKIDSKTGKITVKKKTKKGTYKMNVTVKAAGNGNYNAASATKLVTIKVK